MIRRADVIRRHPAGGDRQPRGHSVAGTRLATTKFARPAPPRRYVDRPWLHAAVDEGELQPLTIVVGVPGAGKSVLLGGWLDVRPNLAPIWLSCDERDEDPTTLWLGLATALRRSWPDRWLEVFDLLG